MDNLQQSRVEDSVASEVALQERANYIAQAFSSYEKHDYKQAILLLRNITLTDAPSIAILVNCAYDFWRSVQPESDHGDHKSGWHDKTPDQEEAQSTVKEAFTQLLGGGDREIIPAYDYVRLSHVYISEAALQGALQICQLGQARGHLENILVIIQSWSILKRVKGRTADIEHCMEYMCTGVQLEPRDNELGDPYSTETETDGEELGMSAKRQLTEQKRQVRAKNHQTLMEFNPAAVPGMIMIQDSDLPLGFAYLFCASHVYRRSIKEGRDPKSKSKDRDFCYNMLGEAFFILEHKQVENIEEMMKWFLSFEMFFDMGMYLEKSAFPLLAEEAYWEAFLRNPLLDISLEYLVSLMHKMKRGSKRFVYEIMIKAYDHNPWNTYARTWLADYEKTEASLYQTFYSKYTAQFEIDRTECAKIQAAMRGYMLRVNHWVDIYWRAKRKKDEWDRQVAQAVKDGSRVRRMLHLDRLLRWKKYSDELHELRRISSTLIQKVWRKHWAGIYYHRKLARAIRANGRFLFASQHHYNVTRSVVMRRWEGFYRAQRLEKSARCLREVILSNGYSVIFKDACHRILSVIKVSRRHSNKKVWFLWLERFTVRKKRSARVAIRFWLRDTITRYEEAKQQAELERRMKAVAYLQEKSTAYILPLKKLMWGYWREVLYERRAARGRMMVRKWLPRAYARQRAYKDVRVKRVKKEIHLSFEQVCLFRRVGKYLVVWRRDRATRPIQRAIRQYLARKSARRWRKIWQEIRIIRLRREAKSKKESCWRWCKLVYLNRREYHRSARKITICFQRWLRVRHVYRACQRKPPMYQHLWAWHKLILRRAFRKMSAGVVGLHTMLVLGPVFLSRWRQSVRVGFWRWRRQIIQQRRIHGIYNLLVSRRLKRRFWDGAGESVVINTRFMHNIEGEAAPPAMAKTSYLMRYERDEPSVLPPKDKSKLQVLNSEKVAMSKAFKTWMACRRYRRRLVRNVQGGGVLAANLVYKGQLMIFLRQRAARMLQRRWRIYQAKNVLRKKKLRRERLSEIHEFYESQPRYRNFKAMAEITAARIKARLVLQCFWRQRLSRNRRGDKHHYKAWLRSAVDTLNRKSGSARAVLRKYFARMQVSYVYRMCGLDETGMVLSIDNIQRRQNRRAYDEQQQQLLYEKRERQSRTKRNILKRNRLLGNHSPGSIVGHGRYAGLKRASKSTSSYRLIKQSQSSGTLPPADWEDDFDNSRRSSMTSEDHSTVSGSSIHSEHYSTSVTAEQVALYEEEEELGDNESMMMKMYGDDGYQHLSISAKMQALTATSSPDFHSHMYRLQQTGIFIFDPYTMAAALGDKNSPGLRPLELAFIMQSAQTIFVQNTTSSALKSVYHHFVGRKIVLCGGALTCVDALYMLVYVSERRETVSIHISDTYVAFSATLAMIQCIGEPSTNASMMLSTLCRGMMVAPPSLNCLVPLKELSVDTESIGPLGMALFVANLRNNNSIETLVIKIASPSSILACYGKCFRLLASNNHLKELRIFGAALGPREVTGLYEAVYGGLRGLSLLEFGAQTDSETATISSRVIDLAKDRLYAGLGSLSVSVI